MRLCSSRGLLSLFGLVLLPIVSQAQPASGGSISPSQPALAAATDPRSIFLPLLVTDSDGRLVTTLDVRNFAVTEDGHPQTLHSVSTADEPSSVGILLDLSGSMERDLPEERNAVLQFLRTSNPQDEFLLMAFSNHPELLSDLTSSRETIAAKLDSLAPGHRTTLYDAMLESLEKLQQAKYPQRALLVISDGGDNASTHTASDVNSALRRSGVQVNAISMADPDAATIEERSGLASFTEITANSGGRFFPLAYPSQAAEAAGAIAWQLRHQYLLIYASDRPNPDGKWRKVKVKLSPPPGMTHLTVHVRAGYYAPSQ